MWPGTELPSPPQLSWPPFLPADSCQGWHNGLPVVSQRLARLSLLPTFLVVSWLLMTPGSNILGFLQTTRAGGSPACLALLKAKCRLLQPALSIRFTGKPAFLVFLFFVFYSGEGPLDDLLPWWAESLGFCRVL